MHFDPKTVQARWMTRDLPAEELPEIATRALAEGFDGPTLCWVAGLQRPTRLDLENQVEILLRELGCGEMTQEEAARRTACELARRIITGDVTARGALYRLDWELCRQVPELRDLQDSIEFADAKILSEEDLKTEAIAAAERLRQELKCGG